MKNIFTNYEKFEDLEIEFDLKFAGESGQYPGYCWYYDDEAKVNVYVK